MELTMTTTASVEMSLLKKTGNLLKRAGGGLLWFCGKSLYFVFVFPLTPVFHAVKFLKHWVLTSLDMLEETSKVWGRERAADTPTQERDFQWCLMSWDIMEDAIEDRMLLWYGEILIYLFIGIVIIWAALQWESFWPWLEFCIAVPALSAFIVFRGWQIACLWQRQYIRISA